MQLELHYRSDIDLSQPAMQVEIRSHVLRYLRAFPEGAEGVITLGGVEHCFAYVVQDDVVDTVIGPPDYIEQVLSERRTCGVLLQPGTRPCGLNSHDARTSEILAHKLPPKED